MNPSDSKVVRVNHRGRETETHLLTSDNMSIRRGADGERIVELFHYDDKGRASWSIKWTLGEEDFARLRAS